MHTHTHTLLQLVLKKCAVAATLKQTWGMLSQQPINAHTHTNPQQHFVLKKRAVAATLKQTCGMLSQQPINAHTHTQTLLPLCFEKACCRSNFKTNLRDAVTATHKCTHTQTLLPLCFEKACCQATLKQTWGMLSQQPINAHTHTNPVATLFWKSVLSQQL